METTSKSKIPLKVWIIAGAAVVVAIAVGIFAANRLNATTMHLLRTEGTVTVANDEGQAVKPTENLALYGGYGVETKQTSYAWIDLDEVKLTKMDQDSEIQIHKEDKHLEIEVKSGSLFFNVTQPLQEDETLNIRTSTMVVGIRGTCGWVVDNGEKGAQVYILNGQVEAEATDTGEVVTVSAGEMAQVTVTEDGKTQIEVLAFAEEYVAPFVLSELEEDTDLSAAVLAASGLDVLNPPDPVERLKAEYEEIIASQTILDAGAAEGTSYTADGVTYAAEGLSYAFCADLDGNGAVELILLTQKAEQTYGGLFTMLEVYGEDMGHAVLYSAEEFGDKFLNKLELLTDGERFYLEFNYFAQTEGDSYVYALEDETLKVVNISYFGDSPDWTAEGYGWSVWERLEGEADERNLCPGLPVSVQQKAELLKELNSHEYEEYPRYAGLMDTDQDGEDEMYLLSTDFSMYDWDGTQVQSTVLESNIAYAKLIDMDQDGKEELLLIKTEGDHDIPNYLAKVYSLNESGTYDKILDFNYNESIHGAGMDGLGLYCEKTTGDVYLGGESYPYGIATKDAVFISLTDSAEASFGVGHTGGLILSDEELAQIEAENERRRAEYEATVNRFELVESIDIDSQQWQEALRPTVEAVKQQLMER